MAKSGYGMGKNYSAGQMAMLFAVTAFIVFIPELAYATNNTPMGRVLCTVVRWFTGNTGKGLATIAVCVIGIGALNGKVSWGMAITVGIGIAIIFGAEGIVNSMNAGASTTCSTT